MAVLLLEDSEAKVGISSRSAIHNTRYITFTFSDIILLGAPSWGSEALGYLCSNV